MANDKVLSDDYVAELLVKDARESSIRYSAMGLEGFAPSKYVSPSLYAYDLLTLLDLQPISPSPIQDFSEILSRKRTITMRLYWPKRLLSPGVASKVSQVMPTVRVRPVEWVEVISGNDSWEILLPFWVEAQTSGESPKALVIRITVRGA